MIAKKILLSHISTRSFLDTAIKIAADYTVECIRITAEEKGANAYGVNFELAIPYLLSLLKNEK